MFNFIQNCQIVFPNMILHSHQQCIRFHFQLLHISTNMGIAKHFHFTHKKSQTNTIHFSVSANTLEYSIIMENFIHSLSIKSTHPSASVIINSWPIWFHLHTHPSPPAILFWSKFQISCYFIRKYLLYISKT